ncbi:hypothetical protein CLAIMM_06155 isoform 2 [Cladophialophora immunda]|nr:hypothetical protein CLAIMM_06155 isoform 2 [Cladophialophora immunda]
MHHTTAQFQYQHKAIEYLKDITYHTTAQFQHQHKAVEYLKDIMYHTTAQFQHQHKAIEYLEVFKYNRTSQCQPSGLATESRLNRVAQPEFMDQMEVLCKTITAFTRTSGSSEKAIVQQANTAQAPETSREARRASPAHDNTASATDSTGGTPEVSQNHDAGQTSSANEEARRLPPPQNDKPQAPTTNQEAPAIARPQVHRDDAPEPSRNRTPQKASPQASEQNTHPPSQNTPDQAARSSRESSSQNATTPTSGPSRRALLERSGTEALPIDLDLEADTPLEIVGTPRMPESVEDAPVEHVNAPPSPRSKNVPLQLPGPELPIEGTALTFFAWFVTSSRRPETVTSYLDELPTLLLKASKRHPVLDSALRALSLVLYGLFHKSEPAVDRARLIHASSQRMLAQLTSPDAEESVSSDELIVSELLSEFYELCICLQEQRPFRKAQMGCLERVLELRSKEPFPDALSNRVFSAARHQIACYCVETSQSATQILGRHVFICENDPGSKLTREAIRVSDFLDEFRRNRDSYPQPPCWQQLQKGLDIDDGLSCWPKTVPSWWQYSFHKDSIYTNDLGYHGMVHIYHDIQVASVWNCYRHIRIMLLSTIAELAFLSGQVAGIDYKGVRRKAISSMTELAVDICASVPFFVGTRSAATPESKIRYPSLGTRDADLIHRQNAHSWGWFLLLVPLSRLQMTGNLPAEQREWAAQQHSRVCAIGDQRYHVRAGSFERLLSDSLPSFACSHAINIQNLAHIDLVDREPTDEGDPMDLDGFGLRRAAAQSPNSGSNSPRTQSPSPQPPPPPPPRSSRRPKRGRRRRREDDDEDDDDKDADADVDADEEEGRVSCECGRRGRMSNPQRHHRERAAKRRACDTCGISFTKRLA